MDTPYSGWWRKHGLTLALLFSAFGIALLVRTVFMAPLIEQFGPLNLYGGGSDSFYHSRVMTFIIGNHANLVRDQLLNFPLTAVNPREPLFDWMNAVFGMIFAPMFGGNAVVAGAWFLDLQGPLWAALGVFPVYLIGREVSSKRMGIVAAFLYPLMVANIDSSTFGYANYLSFYTFFILLMLFGYLKTIRTTGSRRWVESYRHPRQFVPALRQFARVERTSVKWAVFTGVCFGTLALAWQGYSFAVATVVVFLLFALIVERIRRVDSLGLYVNTWIVGLVGFPMAIPYYYPQGLFAGWFDLPLIVFFGALLIALPFVLLRDTPWVVSVPVLLVTGAIAVGLLDLVNHAFFVSIVTGQGYFVKTLVYSTVAEAQAPSIDALILGYGVVTFFLAFVGLGLLVWRMTRQRFPRALMMFLVFGVISIYLPVSAAKFFYLGSAGFALLAAEGILRLLDVATYPELRRTVGQLSDRRGQLTAFRKAFKARHVLVMALVLVIVLPNIWYAVDAGVPYNSKSQYNQQIYNTLPTFLRPAPQNASQFFLGAAGTQLDTPTQYDESGYNWLALQDQNEPAPERPAFISWWDYGFQAVSQGLHPTVADNFQNGIVPAGNFLLAQNESLAIGILATDLLVAEAKKSQQPNLPSDLNAILTADGVDVATLHNLLANPSQDIPIVLAHPERYLAVDPSHLDGPNAMYDVVSYFFASTLPPAKVAQVYDDLQAYTGWSIRYAMVDSRLFPFSGSNTGIFYAPADLTDRVIGPGGAPTAYYSLSIVGTDGGTYPIGSLPAGVAAASYNINYTQAFYNTMIYRTFIGYSGAEIGSSGIPGLSGGVQSQPVEPGWMMQHFQVVYRTAYYCPFASPTGHPNCFTAMNVPEAQANAKKFNGTADTSTNSYFSGGEAMLEYYSGQPMTGTVTLPNGAPVSHAFVTVYDSWGIPHMVTQTTSDGAYSVVLPPGAVTVNVTIGTFQGLSEAGNTVLYSMKIPVSAAYGQTNDAPTLVRPVVLQPATVQGFVYWNTANNSSYIPNADALVPGASLSLWGGGLPRLTATSDASGSFVFSNVPPGVYNFTITYQGANFSQAQVYATTGAVLNKTSGLSAATVSGTVLLPNGLPASGASVTVTSSVGGIVASTQTNLSGGYLVNNLGQGNYSVQASVTAQSLGSPPTSISVPSPGVKLHENLSLAPIFTVSLAVVGNGNPLGGFPVRFTPILPLAPPTPSNASGGPPGGPGSPPGAPGSPGTTNSSVFLTDANGFLTATLPVGNYSIYGLGFVGATLYAGFSAAYLPASTHFLTLPPLFVVPASRLSGVLLGTTVGSVALPTELFVFDARGDLVSALANGTAHWSFELPPGTYSVLAVQGLTTSQAALSATLVNVTVLGDTSLTLTLGPAVKFQSRLGFPTALGPNGIFPAAQATTRLTLEPAGASITALSDANGNVSFVLPAAVQPGESYCLSITAPGFVPYNVCDLSPSQLQGLAQVPLALHPVPVNVSVRGLPTGTTLTLNFTGTSPSAISTSLSGGTSFDVTLPPGTYDISGWARAPSYGLFLPPSSLNLTVPLGSPGVAFVLTVLRQVGATGILDLAEGLSASAVQVQLMSNAQNLTLSGSTFEGRFLVAPGNYTLYASAPGANRSYASLGTRTIAPDGTISSSVALTAPASRVFVNFTESSGFVLAANYSATVLAPGGLTVPFYVRSGQSDVVLPPNETYAFALDTTQLVPTGSGSVYQRFTVVPGSTCTPTTATAYCDIPLASASVMSALSGRLVYPGYPSPLSGTVRLVGPSPSLAVTTVDVTNGTFATPLAPGTYSLYATAGGSAAPVANISEVAVPASPGPSVDINLARTWSDVVTLTPPSAGVLGTATIVVTSPGGLTLTFADEPFLSPIPIVLPVGVYTVTASAPASPFGVATNATATATVALVNGNAATALTLAYHVVQTASIQVLEPTQVTLGNGGVAVFAFVVTNTGNAPEALHFVGSPSTWTFDFRPSNVSLGTAPANRTASVEVTITVPAGTAVAHPTIQLEAVLSSGQPAGFAAPLPVITLTPVLGIVVGSASSLGVSIAPYQVSVGFYVRNTGTVTESVHLSVADAVRLAGLGWTPKIVSGRTEVASTTSLPAGANQSFTVQLVSPASQALPPGSVTVSATVLNGSGPTSTVTLAIPSYSLALNASAIVVTGPSIGSPPSLPDWLVPLLAFVPAIALVTFLVVRRYLKTRSWDRR